MKLRPSFAAFPMFFGAEHRALGDWLTGVDHADLHVPARVVPRLAELGLTKLLVPSVDVRSLCIVREALGYVSPLADSIFAVQGLGSHPLLLAGETERRAEHLAGVVDGTRVCAFGLTEPEAGTDVASLRTTARREGDEWVLDGEKCFISNVGIASHYTIFANADPAAGKKGISAFLVDATTPGLTTEPIPMSVDHPLGRVRLSAARVPGSALIGEVGMGLRLALGTLDVFRTSVGAVAMGMSIRALDEAVAHVGRRVQFGKRLAEFQLTQAAIADMATEIDAGRLLVCRAAWEKDAQRTNTGSTDATPSLSVAMAKMFATEAAQRIIDRAVQLLGGLGVTSSIVERLYREIRPLRIYEGTTQVQQLIIGSALTK